MTAYIVNISKGDTPTGTLEYKTIFAVGLMLFVLTLVDEPHQLPPVAQAAGPEPRL